MTTLEISGDNGSVFLLSCCIPDVEFGQLIMEVDIFDFEIDSCDLSFFFGQEISLSESPEQRGLTYIAITNQYKLVFLFLAVGQVSLFNHLFYSTLFLIKCIMPELIINSVY